MKNTPKKVFILENGNYKELSYEDFCSFKENDISYADKLFIPLHGMLMEVTEETYRNFYKSKRRQKYIDERSAENNDFSYDMLTTDDFNGEDILADESEPLDEQVIRKIMTDKLKSALPLLAEDEQKLIREIFYEELSERTLAEKYGISQVAIHKRKVKILEKLKKMTITELLNHWLFVVYHILFWRMKQFGIKIDELCVQSYKFYIFFTMFFYK